MKYIDKSKYSRADLGINISQMRQLEELHSTKPWLDLLFLYFQTALFVFLAIKLTTYSLFFYPIVIFFISGRQGAFLQLVHEASHNLISKNKALNDFYGQWLTAFLVGVNYKGYQTGHNSHHSYTATDNEPVSDSDKYVIVDFKDPKIYILFLKDVFGISALKIFFNYGNELKSIKKNSVKSKIINIFKLSLVQLFILSLFNFNIMWYFLFWLYPAVGPHMLLMRIRGIAEHGLGKQLKQKIVKTSEGLYYTRSFLTNVNSYKFLPITIVEKLLIGSFNVYYHHEHHLNAKIPYYNLEKFHHMVKNDVSELINAPIYEKGYFTAALRTVLVPKEQLEIHSG